MRTNIAYKITGDNPEHLKRFTPYCRKKINMLGTLVILPVVVWLFAAYIISSELLKHSFASSILTAVVCATIVFIIEQTIVRAEGNGKIFCFRVLLGLSLAFISGLALDSIFFKEDVDRYLNEKYHVKADSAAIAASHKFDIKIQEQQNKIVAAKNDWRGSIAELNDEMSGTGGTRIRGYAKASQKKDQLKNEAKDEYQNQNIALHNLLQAQKAAADSAYHTTLANTGHNTLMHRISNLHEIAFSTFGNAFLYILFFFIAVCLEVFVVFMKTYSRKSAYEKHLEIAEKILDSKNKQLLQQITYFDELGHRGREANNVHDTISKHALMN